MHIWGPERLSKMMILMMMMNDDDDDEMMMMMTLVSPGSGAWAEI